MPKGGIINNMKTLIYKNIALETIRFSANNVVLLKVRESENLRTGSIDSTITAIEVGECKNNTSIEVVKTLLRFLLAEFRVSTSFEREFKETEIKQRNILKPFLNSTVIFKTDSEGKLSKAVLSEVKLNQTALSIKPTHKLILCQGKNLKAALHQHAKAILVQCSYISAIKAEAEKIAECLVDAITTTTEEVGRAHV